MSWNVNKIGDILNIFFNIRGNFEISVFKMSKLTVLYYFYPQGRQAMEHVIEKIKSEATELQHGAVHAMDSAFNIDSTAL